MRVQLALNVSNERVQIQAQLLDVLLQVAVRGVDLKGREQGVARTMACGVMRVCEKKGARTRCSGKRSPINETDGCSAGKILTETMPSASHAVGTLVTHERMMSLSFILVWCAS